MSPNVRPATTPLPILTFSLTFPAADNCYFFIVDCYHPMAFMSSRSNARVQASPFSVRLRISAHRVAWFSLRFGIPDKCGSCSSTSRAASRTASKWISSPSSSVNSLPTADRTPGVSALRRPSFSCRSFSEQFANPVDFRTYKEQ